MNDRFWIANWQNGLRQIRKEMAKDTVRREAESVASRTRSYGGVDVDVLPWTKTWQIGYTVRSKLSIGKGGLEWRTKVGGKHYLKPVKDNPLQQALGSKGL